MPEIKVHDDYHKISEKKGNGVLRREVWMDEKGKVTRYNLAYINFQMHAADNGRVIGYDNKHGYHHRHYFGNVEAAEFVSFEDTEERFQNEWFALRSKK